MSGTGAAPPGPCPECALARSGETRHLHVNVVTRPPDLPAGERGPRVFASEPRADEDERAALAGRVHARLLPRGAASPPADSGR